MKARIAIVLAALVLAGCSPSKEQGPGPAVVARVDGAPVTASRLQDSLRLLKLGFSNTSGLSPSSDAKMDLLSQLVEEEMYMREAARLGVAASGAEVEARYKKTEADYPGDFGGALEQAGLKEGSFKEILRRKVTVEKLLAREVYSKIKVERAAEEDYFRKNRGSFSRPAMVRARQIVVDNPAEAEKILKELKKGADFAALARKESLSPDSAKGGDLGWFSRGQMPPQFDAVFRLKAGRISGVVKSPYGYHIFKVEEASRPARPTFREAEPEVRRLLAAKLGEDEFGKWYAGLKARTKVEINFELLKNL